MKTEKVRRRFDQHVKTSRLRNRGNSGGGLIKWVSVYDFDTFEKKCLHKAWFKYFRPSCAHTIELNNLIRFPTRSDYLKHLDLLDRYNKETKTRGKFQRAKQLQFILAYFVHLLDKHDNQTEAEDELKKVLRVLHPYYYIALVGLRYDHDLDESSAFTKGILHRVSQKPWVQNLGREDLEQRNGGAWFSWWRKKHDKVAPEENSRSSRHPR